jgi:hypothetical protein
MKTAFGLCALLLCCVSSAQIKRIEPRWVLVSHPLKWEAPPPEIENRKSAASAGVMVLYPNGDFGEVWVTLYRIKGGRVSISRGDSHVVRLGTWSKTGDRITVKARVVYADALQMGKPISGPETILTMKAPKGVDVYRVEGSNPASEFRRLPELRDMDFLAAMIACDRSFWDGQTWVEPASLPCTEKK